MEFSFDGTVALVTGAAHGIGQTISRELSTRCARVWATDILPDDLAETERGCREAGGRCQGRRLDVTDEYGVNRLVSDIVSSEGKIDILVNVAGGVYGVLFFAPDLAARCTGQVLSIDGGKAMF